MKKFICVFPKGENVHLIKDVGLIPYFLFKGGYFNSGIAFYAEQESLSYLQNEVRGLKYQKIKRVTKNDHLNVFFFLLKRISSMDIVMMFHPNYYSLSVAFLIKVLSFNRIKFYFKMDLDSTFDFVGLYKKSWKRFIFNFLMRKINLLSAEAREDCSQFEKLGKFAVKHIPNGLIPVENKSFFKENILLTVGRLGSYQKDTQTLLKAFAIANPKEVTLVLIGPFESDFHLFVQEYFKEYPHLMDKIEFKGSINDREELMSYYRRSKFFVLSSRHEGFPLVLLEAIANGCFILSSDFPAARDIVDNELFGRLFNVGDYIALANLIVQVDESRFELPDPDYIAEFSAKKYDWAEIAKEIYLNLK